MSNRLDDIRNCSDAKDTLTDNLKFPSFINNFRGSYDLPHSTTKHRMFGYCSVSFPLLCLRCL